MNWVNNDELYFEEIIGYWCIRFCPKENVPSSMLHDEMLSDNWRCDCFAQCVNRPAVCVAVMLLLAVAHGKRACDYSVIISTYRAVTLVELQNLVSVLSDKQNPRQTDFLCNKSNSLFSFDLLTNYISILSYYWKISYEYVFTCCPLLVICRRWTDCVCSFHSWPRIWLVHLTYQKKRTTVLLRRYSRLYIDTCMFP